MSSGRLGCKLLSEAVLWSNNTLWVCAVVAQGLWAELSGPFQKAVDSFQLVPTTRDYIPPDQNPW